MHRAIGRVFRGQCRKFRDNDCPVAAGEEVRRNNKEEDSNNGFIPRKHSLEEAVTWTAGLVIGYQLTHHRRRALIEQCPPATSVGPINGLNSTSKFETTEKAPCPFSLTSKVFSQPIFSQPSSALSVGSSQRASASPPSLRLGKQKAVATSAVISSIDVTPFIHDDAQDSELPERLNTPNTLVDDDDIVFAYESSPSAITDSKIELADDNWDSIPDNAAEYGIKFGADLLSVLGAFEFLQEEAKAKSSATSLSKKIKNTNEKSNSKRTQSVSIFNSKNPPVHAMDLMKRGAELGSARAVYNIGVAYERLNDPQLAREYYKKAADLGHPLATYNCAVFALRDGHLTEGYALMKTASDWGVPEAEEFMKPLGKSLAPQIEVGKV